MIPRYTLPEMAELWSENYKFQLWLDVEMAAARVMARHDIVPADAVQEMEARLPLSLDPDRIDAIEQKTRHDVIAFLTHVEEIAGQPARILHYGMTSYDVVDTALALRMRRAGELILEKIDRLLEVLKARAMEFRHTPMVGRSHGIHAEPVTFGVTLARWYTAFSRSRQRIQRAVEDISFGKLSGAVGVYGTLPPVIEEETMEALGLKPEPVSSQVIPRDRHAVFYSELAVLGSIIDDVAINLRHLQRTEVHEVEEAFAKGQKGSSAMPHKKNPVSGENLSGQARLLRSYAQAALENVALWHERDIGHSSVERVIGPDATTTAHYAVHRLTNLVENLNVFPGQMEKNLNLLSGLIFSEKVLLALVNTGLKRQEAYVMVQRCAMRTWDEGISFRQALTDDAEVEKLLTADGIAALFDMKKHLRNVDAIFGRVFGE